MEGILEQVVTAVVGAFGGGTVATLYGKWADSRLAARKQPLVEYQELVSTMREQHASDVSGLVERVKKLEASDDKCREENAKMQREIGRLSALVEGPGGRPIDPAHGR